MYDKNKTQSRIIKVTNTSLVFHIETTVVEYTWCFCREANLFLSATSGSEHKLLNWPTLYLYAAKLSLNAKKMIDNLSSENNWSRLIQDRICVKVQKLLRTADRLPYLQIGRDCLRTTVYMLHTFITLNRAYLYFSSSDRLY